MGRALISLSNQMELMSLGTCFLSLAEICSSDVCMLILEGLYQDSRGDLLARRAS